MRKLPVVFLLASLSLHALALPAPTGFSFAKGAKFTVTGYAAGKPALSGFPVLVRLQADSPVGFSYTDLLYPSTGADLCFVDMAGNGLPFEIDTWNASGESLVWVRLPSMTNGTEFVMCWGGGTSGKTVCGESPFSGYVGVWHMSEASGTVADSSGNGFAATPSGPASATDCVAVSGPVGNGRQCSTALGAANLSYLSVPSYDSKSVGDSFAVSGWFNIGSGQTGNDNDARFFSRKENYQNGHGWEVLWKTSKEIRVRGAASGDNIKVTGRDYAGQGWKHVFIVYDGKNSVFYENGVQKGTNPNGTAATENGKPLAIGGYANDNGSQLLGSVDECRLLDAVPTADWAKAEYDSMNDAAFLTAGEAEPYGELVDLTAGVSVSDVSYTNATIGVSVGSLGACAASASVLVQLAATSDFSSPVWATTYSVTEPGLRTFPVAGLATNAAYFARALVTNSLHNAVVAGPFAFETLAPGAPMASAAVSGRTASSISATVSVPSFGAGSDACTARLEASTDGFATVASFAETALAAPGSAALEVSGLSPFTAYALRLRVANPWGLTTLVDLGTASTLPASGTAELYVDSLGSGNGSSPESALPTIRAALDIAGPDYVIWVRGGDGRAYGVANNADAISIPAALEGLSIRAYGQTPGDGGLAPVAVSGTYIADGGRAAIVSNAAERVTIEGFRFAWTTESLGKNNVANCPLIVNAAPFLTISNCEFVFSGNLPGYGQSGLHQPIIGCVTVPATNLVVAGCSFFNCRPNDGNLGRGYKLLQLRDNAHVERCVFSNCTDIVRGVQLRAGGDICTSFVSFSSNVVFQVSPGSNRPVFLAGYDGPRNIAVSYNRFVNDASAPSARIFEKKREGFQNGPLFHHNTIVGFREFIYAENLTYNASTLKASIFDNIFVLAADATNIIENSSGKINPPSCPPTMFKSGSFYRNNALLTGMFNGGTAANVHTDGWTYDITAGLAIDNTFVLGGTTVPAGTAVPVPPPDFAETNNLFSANFYRPKATRKEGVFNYGRAGWKGENGEYPEYLGALPPLYPAAAMMILR